MLRRLSILGFLLLFACAAEAQVAAKAQPRTVAITVDDLPFASGTPQPLSPADAQKAIEVNGKILSAFAAHHAPAIGFVVGQFAEKLGMSSSNQILKQWTRPDFDLGNHLYSHPDVNTLTAEQVEREITHGEASFLPFRSATSSSSKFLRFPYNHNGDTKEKRDAIASFMSAHGYRLAPCTIDSSDYDFNAAYVLALSARDEQAAAKIRAAYIAFTGAEIDWYSALNKKVFGYEPPHIMLLHDNQLNADTAAEVLSLFEQRGYRFVTLTEALKDPAYAVPETFVSKFGPMWGYRWAQELHVKVNGRDEPNPPAWIDQYTKEHRAAR